MAKQATVSSGAVGRGSLEETGTGSEGRCSVTESMKRRAVEMETKGLSSRKGAGSVFET